MFVTNLKKGSYKFQFGLFAWTHMVLLLVTVQSHFVIINILEGLIWYRKNRLENGFLLGL